jgi:DNA-binding transcriptional MocR family regulator
MLAPLLREMIAAEEPILDAHGLTMWGYVVLLALDRSSMRTQAALAAAIGADKTRIIRTLDDLQDDGYIERRPDPDDRRVRLLARSPMPAAASKTPCRTRSSRVKSAGSANSTPRNDASSCASSSG